MKESTTVLGTLLGVSLLVNVIVLLDSSRPVESEPLPAAKAAPSPSIAKSTPSQTPAPAPDREVLDQLFRQQAQIVEFQKQLEEARHQAREAEQRLERELTRSAPAPAPSAPKPSPKGPLMSRPLTCKVFNQPMTDFLAIVGREYGLKIAYEGESESRLKELLLAIQFEDQPLSDVFEFLNALEDVSFQLVNDTITVRAKSY